MNIALSLFNLSLTCLQPLGLHYITPEFIQICTTVFVGLQLFSVVDVGVTAFGIVSLSATTAASPFVRLSLFIQYRPLSLCVPVCLCVCVSPSFNAAVFVFFSFTPEEDDSLYGEGDVKFLLAKSRLFAWLNRIHRMELPAPPLEDLVDKLGGPNVRDLPLWGGFEISRRFCSWFCISFFCSFFGGGTLPAISVVCQSFVFGHSHSGVSPEIFPSHRVIRSLSSIYTPYLRQPDSRTTECS